MIIEFADIYGLPYKTVSSVFKTWLIFMFRKFGDSEWRKAMFVETQNLPQPPKPFQNDYLKNVRVVIDTTSIEVSNFLPIVL